MEDEHLQTALRQIQVSRELVWRTEDLIGRLQGCISPVGSSVEALEDSILGSPYYEEISSAIKLDAPKTDKNMLDTCEPFPGPRSILNTANVRVDVLEANKEKLARELEKMRCTFGDM